MDKQDKMARPGPVDGGTAGPGAAAGLDPDCRPATSGRIPDLALVVCGGEAPPPSVLRRLAACCGLVLAADSGLNHALAAGLAVDCCVGDMDSFQGDLPPGLVVHRHPRDKDHSDTWLALELACRLGARRLWLAGGGGGRMDHLLALRDSLARHPAAERWYTAHDEMICIRKYLGVPVASGSVVSFFAMGAAARVRSRGLRWPLDGLVLDRDFCSLSNETLGGRLEVWVDSGAVLMIRALEAAALLPLETDRQAGPD